MVFLLGRKLVVVYYGLVEFKFLNLHCVGLGWVSQIMGWVRSGHRKWNHGQLCPTSPSVRPQRKSL